jgi:hypothetical protein
VLGTAQVFESTIKDQFREAMRGVASTVFLLTTRVPGGNAGMTATAVCSLSLDPVSVLVCVKRATAFMNALEASGRFVVNVRRHSAALLGTSGDLRRAIGMASTGYRHCNPASVRSRARSPATWTLGLTESLSGRFVRLISAKAGRNCCTARANIARCSRVSGEKHNRGTVAVSRPLGPKANLQKTSAKRQ